MRFITIAFAFVVLTANCVSVLAVQGQDCNLSTDSIGAILQKRTAINTGDGNGDSDGNDGINNSNREGEGEEENISAPEQGIQPLEERIDSIESPLPESLIVIVNQQARVMAMLLARRGAFFEDVLVAELTSEIPYLSQTTAQVIVARLLEAIRPAEFPEAAANRLLEAEIDQVSWDEMERRMSAIVIFLDENSDLMTTGLSPNLVKLAENQSRILAFFWARRGLFNADVMAGYLESQNRYLDGARADEIAQSEIALEDVEGSAEARRRQSLRGQEGVEGEASVTETPSLMQRVVRWWRNGGNNPPGGGTGEGGGW